MLTRISRRTLVLAAVPAAVLVVIACTVGNESGSPASADAGATTSLPHGDAGVVADARASAPADSGLDAATKDAGLAPDAGDAVVLSFAFMGGCRVDSSDLQPKKNPSSANTPELLQTFADIAALASTPKYFFFTGDLVDGMTDGADTLTTQLDAWAALWTAGPLASKLSLIPMVGNHEMLEKPTKGANKGVEISNAAADAVFSSFLSANGFAVHAGNGPTNAAPNADALADDQSKLTYSFDDGPSHFVVMNTDTLTTTPDPATGTTQIGWVPLAWLTHDIQAAQSNPAITGIYVFGHKPLVAPSGATDSNSAINPALAPALMTLFDGNTKVRGYFTSHAHQWSTAKLAGARGVPQIIAGNGGSSLDSTWTEPNPYFGFSVTRVYASGKLGIVSYRRPAPTPYNSTTVTAAVPAPEMFFSP